MMMILCKTSLVHESGLTVYQHIHSIALYRTHTRGRYLLELKPQDTSDTIIDGTEASDDVYLHGAANPFRVADSSMFLYGTKEDKVWSFFRLPQE